MQLDVQCLRHGIPVAQILEESRVGRRIQSLPFAILVSFPRDVVEGWWSVLRLGDHGEHKTPRVELRIPHQVVFEHARFTDHSLQHSGHIADDCDSTS